MSLILPTIGVVMPSYLSPYQGAAQSRPEKFKRAVNSFLANTYPNKFLVIVSDGCSITNEIYKREFEKEKTTTLLVIPKTKEKFSGMPRQKGIELLRQILPVRLVTYLDTDDYLYPDHLNRIVKGFNWECDWCYYNDWLFKVPGQNPEMRNVFLLPDKIGTSNITHKIGTPVEWGAGYGHDWKVIAQLLKLRHVKIDHSGYVVCHIPGQFDN